MSGGVPCRCAERTKPIGQRNWTVRKYKCNHSAFNGYHETPSDYSTVTCENPNCLGVWRTKAGYVEKLLMRAK